MTYKFPHFEIWAKYLTEVELAYLILWSRSHEVHSNRLAVVEVDDIEYPYLMTGDGETQTTAYTFGVPHDGKEQSFVWFEVISRGTSSVPYSTRTDIEFHIDDIYVYTSENTEKILKKEDFEGYDFTYVDVLILATEIVISSSVAERHDSISTKYHKQFPNLKFSQNLEAKISKILKRRDVSTKVTSRKFGI